jgi:hypothetical protein
VENSADDTASANNGIATYSAPRLMRTDRSLLAKSVPINAGLNGSETLAMC